MAGVWRLLLVFCLLALIGPALAALAITAWGKLLGCAADDVCTPSGVGAGLAFTLEWAWRRILEVPVLVGLTAGAATGAAYGFERLPRAMLWSLAGACWGPIAALILPYIAVFWSMPDGCRITEGGATPCFVWGHQMAQAYAGAGAAFWRSVVIVPVGIGGLLLTLILSALRQRNRRLSG